MKDKRVVITYGTYDLLHYGHIALLERAKALGDYLIVGVTSDAFDRSRGKLNVKQDLATRLSAVMNTGIADKVIVEEYRGQKIADIRRYGVDVFTIGSDWEGKFDYLKNYCEVVYLERTKGISSTQLRAESQVLHKMGIIGSDYLCERMLRESKKLNSMSFVAYVEPQFGKAEASLDPSHEYHKQGLAQAASLDELFSQVEAVYISQAIDKRAQLIEAALLSDTHVLCEAPLFLSLEEAKRLIALAKERKLILMEALKTRYFPAFEHLKLLLESGDIGEIKDIDASFSHVFEGLDTSDKYQGSFYDLASVLLLPAVELLGSKPLEVNMSRMLVDAFSPWTKCNLRYKTADVSLRAGRGMKTEGDMTITGTQAYVYVPAPWWKTEYFELRCEDLRESKKFFYPYAGEGQRYELNAFVRAIEEGGLGALVDPQLEEAMLLSAQMVEQFDRAQVHELEAAAYSFGGGERLDR